MNERPEMPSATGQPIARRILGPLLTRLLLVSAVALVAILFWQSLRVTLGPDLRLDLGSINFPTKRLGIVWNAYGLWGSICAAILFLLIPSRLISLFAACLERNPRRSVAFCIAILVLLSVAVRTLVLQFQPLTDDESAYKFAAETLGSGHLSIPTPPFGEHLARAFVIIEDRIYTQYFLGWPAILALGKLLGIGEAANGLLSALCLIPLALILRRFASTPIVIAGLLVYSASLMVVVMSATQLAHPAATLFLLLFIERSLRLIEGDSPSAVIATHAALAFSAAFFVRPGTALAIGLPFLLVLAFRFSRVPRKNWRAALGFAVTATICGALFLMTNWALYGGPFETGYGNYQRHAEAIERVAYLGTGNDSIFDLITQVASNPILISKLLWAAVVRLSYDFLGWPLPVFVLSFLAVVWDKRIWLFVASVTGLVLMHALISDFGIDSFGPVHLYEAGPLLIVMLCGAAQIICGATEARGPINWRGRTIGPIHPLQVLRATLALCIAAWVLYYPVRMGNIQLMVTDIAAPNRLADSVEGDVVVFAPMSRWGTQLQIKPLRHFVFFMPMNDIEFRNRVLWLREPEDDAEKGTVMDAFPSRRAYSLRWYDDGEPVLVPIVRKSG